MATIDVRRSHDIGKEAARKAAEQIAQKLKDKLSVTYRWEGDDLRFERTGASGRIRVTDTEVRVEVDLGFLLKAMKGKVESKVHQYLDEALGPKA
jgi:putative polyhydroxyalkanoate system protein